MRSLQLRFAIVVAFAAIWTSLSIPQASAQAGLNTSGSSNCTLADFDTTIRFVNGPGDYFTLVFDKLNISMVTCVFDGAMYGPSLVPVAVEGHKQVDICYDCENRLPNGFYPIIPPLRVPPETVVRQTFRWKTVRHDSEPCVHLEWLANPILLVTPSLFEPVCSDVEVSRFSLVDPKVSADMQSEKNPGKLFRLGGVKAEYYPTERFSLHVSLAHSDSTGSVNDKRCPTLYLRERSPDGATRIDEVTPLSFVGCEFHALGHAIGDWQSGFDLDSGSTSRWEGVGEHEMQIFQLASSLDAPTIRFNSSNVLKLKIIDSITAPRTWGPKVAGIAADITLDKETYQVGEDVPLHIAIEDFDAGLPLYVVDPVWDPCEVIGLQVQDATARTLPVNERYPHWSICTGHGFGPRPFPVRKVIAIEKSLGAEGWLPNHPGTYTVVVEWAPCFKPKATEAGSAISRMETYAVARAVATIKVVENAASSQPR